MKGKQTINCSIQSCKHYESGDYCNLSAIQVAPCSNMSTGIAEDESMCASYESKQ